MKLNDSVQFVGKQSNVMQWLDKSNIFVYPSVWQEAFGIAVVEAMARGCIVVTFNKGGLPEIIQNKENGYIVLKDNAKELSQTLQFIINDSITARNNIVKNAIQTSTQFTIDKVAKRLNEELEMLLK